jgi:subtilase family serine protease
VRSARRGAASLLLVLAALLLPAAAAAAPGASDKTVELLLELRHPQGLDRFVEAVTDPSSPRYRHYGSVAGLARRFGASAANREAALRWLAARGLHGSLGPSGTYLTARAPRGRAARLLPRAAGATASSAAGPGRAVPAALRGVVSAAAILDERPRAFKNVASASRASASRAAPPREPREYSSIRPHTGTATGCAAGRTGPGGAIEPPFTPNQFLHAYGIDALQRRGLRGQGEQVALVEIDGFRRADVVAFDRCFGAATPPLRVVPVFPNPKPYGGGTETTLDLEVMTVAAPRLKRIDVYEGLGTEGGILISAATALGSPRNRPDVISISLGICEPMYSGQLVMRRALNSVFAVAAGAGISVLVAAGDTGSSGCRVDGKAGTTALPVRAVSLPSSSPYVTAVGGTNLKLNARNRILNEFVWNDSPLLVGGGGGGASLLTARRPWWQRAPGLDRFGVGRIVPDLAALADVFPGYAYYCTSPECAQLPQFANHGWTSIGGTSAATPLMAAATALADQLSARHRQAPIGFLNPLLYRLGSSPRARRGAFFDVRRGDDDLGRLLPREVGGGHRLGCCAAGRGYDWASGWGSLKGVGFAKSAARLAP